ncbi:hypothetical protein AALA83_11070 [Oscillospiraceae bacterium 44-5]|uniref:hypothetical protein n=1 Tax=Lawsonibacter sp. JLR.KK007 TaxID=3114293 RepID=UPI002170840B|nr:hypothetical protein [Lawsonibacter sp.]
MNQLATYQQSDLPVRPTDLAKFILIAPEKVKVMQAEIRAIQKAQLAKEVYDQKKAELDRLRELMLLAYQRMGEITREIPKDISFHGNQHSEVSSRMREDTKSKKQVIQDLGFSTSQVGRMEQLAAHPDIVEEVVAESRAGQTEATQGEVLRRIKEREKVIDLAEVRQDKFQADMDQIDRDYDNLNHFRKITCFVGGLYEITDEILDSVAAADDDLDRTIKSLEEAAQLLVIVKSKLQERRIKRGKKNLH